MCIDDNFIFKQHSACNTIQLKLQHKTFISFVLLSYGNDHTAHSYRESDTELI